jgi:hypothetical protein
MRAPLETQRDVALPAGLDEIPPADRQRPPRRLLIAGQHHPDRGVLERAGLVQRPQREQDRDVAALHVGHPGSASRIGPDPLESLERTVRLEHGVEVSDEEHAPATHALSLGEEVRATLHLSHVCQQDVEAQGLEPRSHQLGHRPHTDGVQRPTVDVHCALEEIHRSIGVRLDALDNPALERRERRRGSQRRGPLGRHGAGRTAGNPPGNQERRNART